jgi:hypothetical protein
MGDGDDKIGSVGGKTPDETSELLLSASAMYEPRELVSDFQRSVGRIADYVNGVTATPAGSAAVCQAGERERLAAHPDIEIVGPVLDTRTVSGSYELLEPGVQNLLRENGVRIVMAPYMSAYDSELAQRHPRGWSDGKTYDNVSALYRPQTKEIVVASHRMHDGELIPATESRGRFLHETGHAVNDALGRFSESEEFKAAWDKDLAAMSDEDRDALEYFVDNSAGDPAARSEAAAEVFAATHAAHRVLGALSSSCAVSRTSPKRSPTD